MTGQRRVFDRHWMIALTTVFLGSFVVAPVCAFILHTQWPSADGQVRLYAYLGLMWVGLGVLSAVRAMLVRSVDLRSAMWSAAWWSASAFFFMEPDPVSRTVVVW